MYCPDSEISITRLMEASSDVYDYALSAYRLLFSHLVNDPSTIPADLRRMEDTYLSPKCGGCFLVARNTEGDIVGIIAFRTYVHRFVNSSGDLRTELNLDQQQQHGKGKVVEVVRLFVSPYQRGKGSAKRLIEALVDEAREENVRVMYLHTHPFLPGAERLWTKMGWEVLVKDHDSWECIHMLRSI